MYENLILFLIIALKAYFFDEYLSTSLDDLEYDDAIVKDHRTFCEYLMECLKEKHIIVLIAELKRIRYTITGNR